MSNLMNKLYFKGLMAKDRVCKFFKEEKGEANIIAIILVLAIVLALAIFFRGAIKGLFDTIWGAITNDVSKSTGTFGA